MDKDYRKIAEAYPEAVKAWKAFYNDEESSHSGFDDIHFGSLSLGFFIAAGVTGDSGTGEAFYDAFILSYHYDEL